MQIDFDPTQISFSQVVDHFWQSHDPRHGIRVPQYMAAIWFHDDSQKDTINAAREVVESNNGERVQTPVLALDVFYPAEDYHQKYCLQNSPLRSYFRAMFSSFEDFNTSTAAARLNGFIAGQGNSRLYEEEHRDYGIPVEALNELIQLR